LPESFYLENRVAREAASLLYFGAEKEYKQAKTKAAEILGVHFLPSNLEVAFELDKIAEENEGVRRKERLVKMRQEALDVMRVLVAFYPILIGSVWRGTINQGSDIDIAVYSDKPEKIVEVIKNKGIRILKTEWSTVNKCGANFESFHVYAETSAKNTLEIVVRNIDDAKKKRKCEIFGDEMKGLNIRELKKIVDSDPTKKFIPF
jgi:predicted nucleotidyltransferase